MKRVLTFIMALTLLCSSAVLVACSDKNKNDGKGTAQGSVGGVAEEDSIFYERSLVSDELPERNYGGREFRVVIPNPDEIFTPEDERNKGDLIKDAVFERNTAVEERFGVKIKVVYEGFFTDVSNYVSKTVLSGVDEFDLLMGQAVSTGGLVTKNLFLNWYNIEFVDFTKPWWAESCLDELTYNGKCPIAVSDLNHTAIARTYCMVFNKNLAASYEYGDIYKIVLDGKWTFDKMLELVKDTYQDDNGNNERDEGDFYGFAHSQGSPMNAYLWAFDNPVCKKDDDGVPQIAVNTDKIDSIVQGLYDLCFNTTGVYFEPDKINEQSIMPDIFFAKRSIFMLAELGYPTNEKMRDFEDDYGLVPYPKWDENQPAYYTMADGGHTILAVPKTCQDTEFVGIITEALSAESWKTLTPTLYEIALKTRYLRDSESKEIMDLIVEGRTFDFGYIYDNWKGYSFTLERMMKDQKSNFQSEYKAHFSSARTQYKATVKAFDKMT